jgi:transposase
MYLKSVKVPSSNGTINEYIRVVESYREGPKVKQRLVADLGRKDVLVAVLPRLRRLLEGTPLIEGVEHNEELQIVEDFCWGPLLVIRQLFASLDLWTILDRTLGPYRGVPWADRAFVLIANRLIHPTSEHGLAAELELGYFCDRAGRRFLPRWHTRRRVKVHHQQLDAWYHTLDRLLAAKGSIEEALYAKLRDLFSLKPDLVLYDITSTYFEGSGPQGFARHGYSRDGKPRNPQVIVGVVMVGGWPIVHHVWEGNRLDHSTVEEVLGDLRGRFEIGRVVFVGDRGMVSEDNLRQIKATGQGYLVGIRRRNNAKLDGWLSHIDESSWVDCPVGITSQEKNPPPRTRVQEVASGEEGLRVFVIDSEERAAYEQAMRARAMERVRGKLERLQRRVQEGGLRDAAKIGAAAQRIIAAHHGWRYYRWKLIRGRFHFEEDPVHLEREKRLEGKYLIATTERQIRAQEAVRQYKELSDVERGFRSLKDVLAMRPIYHRKASRVKAHIFVAAMALLLTRLLERRLKQAKVELSAEQALRAVSGIRVVNFRLAGQPQRQGVGGGSPRARQVLKALGIMHLKPPTAVAGAETVM